MDVRGGTGTRELPRSVRTLPPGARRAVIIDVETTGLDPRSDEIVELAAVLFAFERERGLVYGIVDEYAGLQEPAKPIPAAATRVHRITDEVVRGQRLDRARIASILRTAEFVIAHNAGFDRGFVSRLIPGAERKPWLCSMDGINWYARGHSSRALQALLRDYRLEASGAHRALDDARALLRLLSHPSPSGQTNLAELLRRQGRVTANGRTNF